ncbi:MAG: ribulose 1,5-bisphosphate carboxylase [Acidobacteriota bacterium]|nr:MAG: ribulose 1,5-bisphosphate carboxylase [Acidobacteriota bacterium]
MDRIRAIYRIESEPTEIETRAEALAREQTVELPREALRDRFVIEQVLGTVEKIEPDRDRRFRVTISYSDATQDGSVAQLVNVLFGNSSLQPDVELWDAELPVATLSSLGGPRWGIAGLRDLTQVRGRALTATALKPVGLANAELAAACEAFALAGIDVIKDDHGITNQATNPFEQRIVSCQRAVESAAQRTGRASLYVPNVSGGPSRIRRQLDAAQQAGVRAVMLSPLLIGLPTFHELIESPLEMPVIAHPAFAGAQKVAPELMLGKLLRVLGADAVIFPHAGGRFRFGDQTCRWLADRLRQDVAGLRSALPVPAGGMELDRVAELVEFYGADTMLLLGASLHVGDEDCFARARTFAGRVAAACSPP